MSPITAVQLAFWTPLAGALLFALIWTWQLAGTQEFVEGGSLRGETSPTLPGVLFALYVFGISKAALMPLHRWLPAAMVAPTPVSALLRAVAVVKGGALYRLTIPLRAFFYPPAPNVARAGINEAPTTCLLAMGITAFGCVGLFFYADSLHAVAQLLTGENSHG